MYFSYNTQGLYILQTNKVTNTKLMFNIKHTKVIIKQLLKYRIVHQMKDFIRSK